MDCEKMRELFAAWINNGHNDFDDVNTCIHIFILLRF